MKAQLLASTSVRALASAYLAQMAAGNPKAKKWYRAPGQPWLLRPYDFFRIAQAFGFA